MTYNKTELKNEELEKVSKGNSANGSISVIKGAIYKESNIFVYVNGV